VPLSASCGFAGANEDADDICAVTLQTAEWKCSGLWRTDRVKLLHKALRQSLPYQGQS